MQVEVTGPPCSGKSYYLKGEAHLLSKNKLSKFYFFWVGGGTLSYSELILLIRLCSQEKVSFIFKLNIFYNALIKFGVFHKSINNSNNNVVDEGISHLAFNFLEAKYTDLELLVKDRLPLVHVKIIVNIDDNILKERLLSRGHTRLRYYSIDNFLYKNHAAKIKAEMYSKKFSGN
ncbi:hypothetical protein EAY27_27455, partial [Vibrio anguillarum]|uniref:hypothetical protein n=1 Tax=Vibrio anguillarum TaxID=55601 RepID=UPI00188A9B1C